MSQPPTPGTVLRLEGPRADTPLELPGPRHLTGPSAECSAATEGLSGHLLVSPARASCAAKVCSSPEGQLSTHDRAVGSGVRPATDSRPGAEPHPHGGPERREPAAGWPCPRGGGGRDPPPSPPACPRGCCGGRPLPASPLTFSSPVATRNTSSATQPTARRAAPDECTSFHMVSLSTCGNNAPSEAPAPAPCAGGFPPAAQRLALRHTLRTLNSDAAKATSLRFCPCRGVVSAGQQNRS